MPDCARGYETGSLPGSNQRRRYAAKAPLEIPPLAPSPLAICLLASRFLASCSAGGLAQVLALVLALVLAATYSRTTYGDT
jgi:hypothetical protein